MTTNKCCQGRSAGTGSRTEVSPAVDIVLDEKGGAYRIVVDLPGVDEREVDVQAHDGELQISDSAAPREVQGDVLCCEVPHRSYLRRFRLAEDVDVERISAHLEAGVLTVELPRVPAKQPKRIEVRAS